FAPTFPLWDLVFGTCYRPAPREYRATGLLPSVQTSLAAAILWPVSLNLKQREVAHHRIRRYEALSSESPPLLARRWRPQQQTARQVAVPSARGGEKMLRLACLPPRERLLEFDISDSFRNFSYGECQA